MFAGRQYGYVIHLGANDLKMITGVLIIACLVVSKYGNGKFLRKKEAKK
jgi:putative ABC transport system permease protein